MKKGKYVFIILLIQFVLCTGVNAQRQFKALLITTTRGWQHESRHNGVVALRELATRNFFDLVYWEDPNGFTDKYVEQFQVIIFLNTTGNIFDSAQQMVMERFIQSGKGYVGIHSASDTEYDWAWYNKLVGRMFKIHPAVQTAALTVLDPTFPGLEGFAGKKLWTDEWYDFSEEKITGLNYVLGVDENSYNAKVKWGSKSSDGMGKLHPIAWYHEFDGGRAFYTALGHLPTVYSDPAFINHLYAGIFWAATGRK
jgi:uncharacterized protein